MPGFMSSRMTLKALRLPSNAWSATPSCARPARAVGSSAPGSSPGLRRRAACDARTMTRCSRDKIALAFLAAHNRASTVEMRIGIDARELCGRPTGVGRHLSGLLREWSTAPAASGHTFVLYSHEAITPPLRGAELRVIPGSPGTKWEQVALPGAAKHDRLDVFFAPGYTSPLLLKTPSVVLVHDISFAAHPEWFRLKEGLRRRLLTRWSCDRARLV